MSDHPCLPFLTRRSRILTKLMEHIPSVSNVLYRKSWNIQLERPVRLEACRVGKKAVWVRSEELELSGFPGPTVSGRIYYQIEVWEYYLRREQRKEERYKYDVMFLTKEDFENRPFLHGRWRDIPEPVEGLYIIPRYEDDPGRYFKYDEYDDEDLIKHASPELFKVLSAISIFERTSVLRYLEANRYDLIDIPSGWLELKWYEVERIFRDVDLTADHVRRIYYVLDRQPNDVLNFMKPTEVFPWFLSHCASQETAWLLTKTYQNKRDKILMIREFIEQKSSSEDVEEFYFTGEDIGSTTKAARK